MSRRSKQCERSLPKREPSSLVVLTGFMGAGKTAVGRALSELLGWRFLDLDEEIVLDARMTIAEFFQRHGEVAFRTMEEKVLTMCLRPVSADDSTILALGGGTLTSVSSLSALKKAEARIFYLQATVDQLWARCQNKPTSRPLLANFTSFQKLFQEREPDYRSVGTAIDTQALSPGEIARLIQQHLVPTFKEKA